MRVKDYLYKFGEDGIISLNNSSKFMSDIQHFAKQDGIELEQKDIRVFSQFQWAVKRMLSIIDKLNNYEEN